MQSSIPGALFKSAYFLPFDLVFFAADFAFDAGLPAAFFLAAMYFTSHHGCFMRFARKKYFKLATNIFGLSRSFCFRLS